MKKSNLLYISMTRRELGRGLCYLAFQLLLLPSVVLSLVELFVPQGSLPLANFLFYLVNFLATGWIFRDFLRRTFQDLHGRHILVKVLLGVFLSRVLTILMNDLFYCFFPRYYVWTATGPQFLNQNDALIASMVQEHFLLMAVGTVLLVPPAEELLYRGMIFGGLYQKSPLLALLCSVSAFSLVHILSFLGTAQPSYLILSFLQYVPTAIFLAWFYAASESIVTPVLMHMAINAIGIVSMR